MIGSSGEPKQVCIVNCPVISRHNKSSCYHNAGIGSKCGCGQYMYKEKIETRRRLWTRRLIHRIYYRPSLSDSFESLATTDFVAADRVLFTDRPVQCWYTHTNHHHHHHHHRLISETYNNVVHWDKTISIPFRKCALGAAMTLASLTTALNENSSLGI